MLQEQYQRREFVSAYVQELAQDAIMVEQKRSALRKIWNSVFIDMIQKAVCDMYDPKLYMKQCMEELEQS